MSDQTKKSYFKKIQQFSTDYSPANISQYVSERTGMNVVIVDKKGPEISGYFALATEILDDSGSPHTLEHLVFMGSKNHPYKGLLDRLSTRAYSNTNAWTDTDHTAYTINTAGWEGLSRILPIYLEHIILPTLTDEACYTEVHHVDGEGNDAGVVYSEMQAIQNTSDEILDLHARRLLYPENVGFHYETGGLMQNLRVLTPERIRSFHREMYQPKNLCLILIGEVDIDDLLQILDKFEDEILTEIPSPGAKFHRPWVESIQPPPIAKTVVEKVYFPEEDESTGEILIAMFGPNCNDPVNMAALGVILFYLAGSSLSILESTMLDKEALASSISYDFDPRPNSVIWLQISGVSTDKLEFVERRLFDLLSQVSSEPLDMSYLIDCIRRQKRHTKLKAESSVSFFATRIISDFLYGKRDGSTLKNLSSIKEYEILEQWSDEDWRNFLSKWISNAPHISLLGTPSIKMSDELETEEDDRVTARTKSLGRKGLKKLANELEAAIAKNDEEIPSSIMEKFPIPEVESIHFFQSTTARSGWAKKLGVYSNEIQEVVNSQSNLPLFMQFEHLPTNFVHITLLLETSAVATINCPLLSLFLDIFFETPIIKNGEKIEFKEVVTKLHQDTVSYSINGAESLSHSEGLAIQFQTEPEKYSTAIEWIHTMMFESIFEESRISARLERILASIPELKRDGDNMANAIDAVIHFDNKSIVKARITLISATFLEKTKELLATDPQAVISSLEALRNSLFSFKNMRVLVIANMTQLKDPVDAWKLLVEKLDKSEELVSIVKPFQRFSPDGQFPGGRGVVIVPMPTIDSSFCIATAKGPRLLTDPVIPALTVTISFLEAVEGPLWTSIRGKGLAYGTSILFDNNGLLQFSVYRSPDAFHAYSAAKDVINSFITGTTKIDSHAFEGAVSSIVSDLAEKRATMIEAAKSHFINGVINGVEEAYDFNLLQKVRSITPEQMKAVMEDYLLPLFKPGKANVVVTCAPLLKKGIMKGFKESGFKVQTHELSSFTDSYDSVDGRRNR
ncbi:zinc metalloprotease [Blumeria hordei DH14]|uniref:Zinc metalloprotease n=1 Tax=Blumeria graminis f. sp. hordei (strain DH14) TaxID=546991 RepID=N1JGT5_BLUG1|nr:zinc metalloprotease [Blumeria hordei DH14]